MPVLEALSILEHYQEDGGAGLTTSNITTIEKYTNKQKHKYTNARQMAVLALPSLSILLNNDYIG